MHRSKDLHIRDQSWGIEPRLAAWVAISPSAKRGQIVRIQLFDYVGQYLPKPYKPQELLKKIKDVLQLGRAAYYG